MSTSAARVPEHPVHDQFLDRWSSRAYTSEAMTYADLAPILEAARWAPSASNTQPWHFLYSLRGDAHWQLFSSLPNEKNQLWSNNAAALLVILSAKVATAPDGASRPLKTHSFDTGAAWGHLALQASLGGWAAHAMAGFDPERARAELGIPDTYAIEAMVAIGRRGPAHSLPDDLRARELPSPRKPLAQIATSGMFPREAK